MPVRPFTPARQSRRALVLAFVGFLVLFVSVAWLPLLDAARAWLQRRHEAEVARLYEPYRRYYDLTVAVRGAARAADPRSLPNAEAAARRLLWQARSPQLAADFWNRGNAVHYGHILLGRCALQRGDLVEARRELLLASAVAGSPQLSSFGPDMTLADELLRRGEAPLVLEYLSRCRPLWHPSKSRLDEWRSAIERGLPPEFGANSGVHAPIRGAA